MKKWAANDSALAHQAEVFEGIETDLKSLTEQEYKLGIVTSKKKKLSNLILNL